MKTSDFCNNNNKKKKININDFVVNKILVSKNEQYGKYNSFKYFIGYNDDNVIRPLGEGFAQGECGQEETMSFLYL